jgi:hypothetical protein
MAGSAWSYFAYDLYTGRLLAQLPLRSVSFSQQLNAAGQLSGTLDLQDPRVQATGALEATIPNRTFIVVDLEGVPVWGGIVMTRRWKAMSSTDRVLELQLSELWAYFGSRIQATDYSSPPYSGISGASEMGLWKTLSGTWDATLIACQVISDALGYSDGALQPYGNPLQAGGGIQLTVNGAAPSAASPPSGSSGSYYIAASYPWTGLQTVEAIVGQLSQLGLYVGFDFGVELAYVEGPGSAIVATLNLNYPRRGRTFAENGLYLDVQNSRGYEIPEDGTQTANRVYEIGGAGAINVLENVFPQDQGYPLWEKVISRSSIQSAHITEVLEKAGLSDLATYSYAPVTPTVEIGVGESSALPLNSYVMGDNVLLVIPKRTVTGETYDPRFPNGMRAEWRITGNTITVADEGNSKATLTFSQPPYEQATAPAVM